MNTKSIAELNNSLYGVHGDEFDTLIEQLSSSKRELARHVLASGVLSTSYSLQHMYDAPEIQRIDSVPFSAIGMHNHTNYDSMPGLGWFTVHANGHIIQTRHNDYKMYKKVVQNGKVTTVPNYFHPTLPGNLATDIDAMRELMSAHHTGSRELTAEEKNLFRWDLAYLEVYTLKFNSLYDKIGDAFPSFRHGFGEITIKEMLGRSKHYRNTGLKERFENNPQPEISKTDDGKYAVTFYTILTEPLDNLDTNNVLYSTFNGAKWYEIMESRSNNALTTRPKSLFMDRFKIRPKREGATANTRLAGSRSLIDDIVENVRGYDPTDYTDIVFNGTTFKSFNFAKYQRIYSSQVNDATNVNVFHIGWNDPNMLVAQVKDTNTYPEGASYMIPLELVLRTPLENWNPLNIAYGTREQATSGGADGSSQSKAYNNYNESTVFYKLPMELYKGSFAPGVGADTTSVKWIKDTSGNAHQCTGSGIRVLHNEFNPGEGFMRTRFPIYEDAMESGLVGHFVDRARVAASIPLPRPMFDAPLIDSLNIVAGNGSFEFTRSTTATYIDRYGAIKTAAVDEPIFKDGALIVEESATNLITNSNDGNASNVTKTLNTTDVVAPDSTNTAIKVVGNGTADVEHYLDNFVSIPDEVKSYTVSVFVKKGTYDRIRYYTSITGGDRNVVIGFFTFSNEKAENCKVEKLANGWYRLSTTITQAAGGTKLYNRVYTTDQYKDANTETLYVFGFQSEVGKVATSYIPTSTSQVTRASQLVKIDGYNNIPKLSEGFTVSFDVCYQLYPGNSTAGTVMSFYSDDNVAPLYFIIEYNDKRIVALIDGVPKFIAKVNPRTRYRITATYDGKMLNTYLDGVFMASHSINVQDAHYKLKLTGAGDTSSSDGSQEGCISNVRIWDRELTYMEVKKI